MTNEGLLEVEYVQLIKQKENMGRGAFDYLSQYSQIWDQSRKVNDIMISNSIKAPTNSFNHKLGDLIELK